MSWDFDSFNESGFNGFIDSGYDARAGGKAVIWKIDPADGTTIWAADWPALTSTISLLFVTSTHVIAVWQKSLTVLSIKTFTVAGLLVDEYDLTLPSSRLTNVLGHVPTGHIMWVRGTLDAATFERYDAIGKAYALQLALPAIPGNPGVAIATSSASGDIVSLNTNFALNPPDANRIVISGQTGALSQVAAGGATSEIAFRIDSQASTPFASRAINTEYGVATYNGYNISGFTTVNALYGESDFGGLRQSAPATYSNTTYAASRNFDGDPFFALKSKVRKIGGWASYASDSTSTITLAASAAGVFVGTGYNRGGVVYGRIELLKSDDGSKVWAKTFGDISGAPYATSVSADGYLYAATTRAST